MNKTTPQDERAVAVDYPYVVYKNGDKYNSYETVKGAKKAVTLLIHLGNKAEWKKV